MIDNVDLITIRVPVSWVTARGVAEVVAIAGLAQATYITVKNNTGTQYWKVILPLAFYVIMNRLLIVFGY